MELKDIQSNNFYYEDREYLDYLIKEKRLKNKDIRLSCFGIPCSLLTKIINNK